MQVLGAPSNCQAITPISSATRKLPPRNRPGESDRARRLKLAAMDLCPVHRGIPDPRLRCTHVLRSKSQSEHARRNPPQHRKSTQKFKRQWKLTNLGFVAQSGAKQVLVREDLEPLRHTRRIFAPLLDLAQLLVPDRAT